MLNIKNKTFSNDENWLIDDETEARVKFDFKNNKCKVCGDDASGVYYGAGKLSLCFLMLNI